VKKSGCNPNVNVGVFYFDGEMMKRILLVILCLVSVFASPRDSNGSDTKYQRIISLAPSTTEILFALGLDEQIVAVTTFCNYPSEALSKESVGTVTQPDIEKIIFLKPDIILTTGLEQAFAVERLRQLKLNIHVSDPSNVEELFASISTIAELTHRENEAKGLIARMKREINEIRQKTKLIPEGKRKKVFIEIWHDPLITAGQGSFVDELIDMAGGINIAHDVTRPYTYFSAEQLIKRDPDCIILGHIAEDKIMDAIKKRLGWSKISAVKNNHIYGDVNPDIFLRPGPRLAEGLRKIYKRIYPQ
jgi:iron complex transport system substrate-binding protein